MQIADLLFGRQFSGGSFGNCFWMQKVQIVCLKGSVRIPLRFPIADILNYPLSRITVVGVLASKSNLQNCYVSGGKNCSKLPSKNETAQNCLAKSNSAS